MKKKILDSDSLAQRADTLRAQGRKLVLTNGCFDLLHLGHIRFLQAARALGDALVVAINRDESVRTLKGEGRPLVPEEARAEIIAALECVDYVVLFPEVRVTQLLKKVRPAIYAKGGDYTPETLNGEERNALSEIGAEIQIVPFETGHSTTELVRKMKATPSHR